MSNEFEKDKDWADKYIPEIKGICYKVLKKYPHKILKIEVANAEEDNQHATDYIIKIEEADIACRIRRPGVFDKWGDFTLRYSRPSKVKTEFQKILEGEGKWYLYSWVEEHQIKYWVWVDLDSLRKYGILQKIDEEIKKGETKRLMDNEDGTKFVWIKLWELEKNHCILKKNLSGDIIQPDPYDSITMKMTDYIGGLS